MKKFILIFSVIFAFPVNTRADMYHGIDIDAYMKVVIGTAKII